MSSERHDAWLELPNGSRVPLPGNASIGRAPNNTVVLDDEKVSRRHALIQAQEGAEYWLVDMGSANGTHVNGKRIAQPVRLSAGDVIQLSTSTLKFGCQTAARRAAKQMEDMVSTRMDVRALESWFMVADIIGSTRMAQNLSAEELPRVTGNWFKNCREVTDLCGGQVMKYLGDGFFCSWEGCEGALEKVRDAMKRLWMLQDNRPRFRLVLHYGFAVRAGVPTLGEVNLHGQEVNFVYRMEKIAARLNEELLFSEPAAMRLNIRTRQVAELPVQGYDGMYRFFTPA